MEIPKLYKAIENEAFDAQVRLSRAIGEAVLNAYRHGYRSLCIVQWQRVEANRFICAGQIFTPNKEKQARDLAAEMQGTLEIMEFKKAIPAEQLKQLSRSLACHTTHTTHTIKESSTKGLNFTGAPSDAPTATANSLSDPQAEIGPSVRTALNTSTSEDQCQTAFM